MIAKRIAFGFFVAVVMMASGLQARPAWKRRQAVQTRSVRDAVGRRKPVREFYREKLGLGKRGQLNLSNEHITKFTDGDVRFLRTRYPRLRVLVLTHNKIKSLPKTIGKLKGLKKLYIYGNLLSQQEIDRAKKALPKTRIISVAPKKRPEYPGEDIVKIPTEYYQR